MSEQPNELTDRELDGVTGGVGGVSGLDYSMVGNVGDVDVPTAEARTKAATPVVDTPADTSNTAELTKLQNLSQQSAALAGLQGVNSRLFGEALKSVVQKAR